MPMTATDDLTQMIIDLLNDKSFVNMNPYSLERMLFLLDRLYWKQNRSAIPAEYYQLPYIHFLVEQGYSASFIVPEQRRGSHDQSVNQQDVDLLQQMWMKYLAKHDRVKQDA